MKKTRLFSIILAVVMVVSAIFVLVACDKTPAGDETILKEIVAEGQKMTMEQLIEKAKEEKGDFVAYGNTSRITTAMTNFVKAYGAKIGLTEANAKAEKKGDSEIYTLLNSEMNSATNSKNASMVLIQDSASLARYRANTTMLTNYIPMGMEDKVDANNQIPLAHQFINKLFMYNNQGSNTMKFTNVWQLTDASHLGKIYFKSPVDEQVNMNFLIMLTSDQWAKKLEDAYKSLNNGAAATDVGEGKTYKNYGYKWVAEFIKNCNFTIGSDTKIAAALSTDENQGMMGLFVLSKLRDSSVKSDNLNVSAWDKNGDNYQKIEPFAGFMYSIYAQLATYGPRPYTAMLFINYLMTEEGFKPWGGSLGGYSANKDVPVYEDKENNVKDSELSFWTQNLVVEDGEYILTVRGEAIDWITSLLPANADK